VQTEATRVALRLRTPWEAVDLGISMVRSWWLPILASWLALFAPVALAAWLLAPSALVAMIVIWWLKPLFDRTVLNVLAQGVFGPVPRWSDTLAGLPALALQSGLFFSLLPLRLSPQRSLTLPILQLENLRGRAYGRRARTLSGRDVATAVGFSGICLAFELLLVLGLSVLAIELLADPFSDEFDFAGWLRKTATPGWLFPLYLVALTLVEPFYVGGGFGLYLNRRIELEGWDIEVAFRAIARRHERSFPQRVVGLLAALALGGAALCGAARPARADAPLRCAIEEPGDASDCIDRVLTTAEFDRTEQNGGWRLRQWLRDLFEDDGEDEPSSFGLWLGQLLAGGFRIVAWTLLIFGGLAVVGALVRYWAARRAPDAQPAARTALVADEETSSEAPQDLAAAALARFASDPVGALGLLYAGARAHLIARLELALPEGATERECERAARRHARGALVDDFGALTRAWIYCAYAERLPSAETFRELCERWRAHLVSA
jgi:hypothetical protein